MYSYTYDRKTGGILLNSSPTGFSKEPRPVYAPELDVLGFDKYWKYDKQTDYPYMWVEACQSAFKFDPLSASKNDPPKGKKIVYFHLPQLLHGNQVSSTIFLLREWAKV